MYFAIILAALLGLIPATIAHKKGRDFGSWWIFGAGLFIVALPMALTLKPPTDEESVILPNGKKAGATIPIWVASSVMIALILFSFILTSTNNEPQLSYDKITISQYLAIQNGMTYEESALILTQPGQEISRTEMEGIPGVMPPTVTVMYMWTNNNGTNMNAMFQNNKLIQKAQFGLK